MKHIMKCPSCKLYTMKATCSECRVQTEYPKPPKYSPEDKYGRDRRAAKHEHMEV